MLKGLWARITGRSRTRAAERASGEQNMSPEERRFVEGSVEGRQSELEAEAHLGGIDPNRLLDE